MAEATKKSKAAPNRKSARKPSRYKVLGETSDGVKILAPATKPTHFTVQQIRATIAKLRRSGELDPAAARGNGDKPKG